MAINNTFIIGIDAANIRDGGGVTHLVELLRAAQPEQYGITRVIVWGCSSTLNALDDRSWLAKKSPKLLDKNLLFRVYWQRFCLSKAVRYEQCDLLFVPGGNYVGSFRPVITMSQNLLPFEIRELMRYGWTLNTLKLLLLRLTQSRTFQDSDGVIFLTQYACDSVLRVTGKLCGKVSIIPHGLNPRFICSPKLQNAITNYDELNPYRLLYVSRIEPYKHQWHVVEAVATLREHGFPVVLDLVGPANPTALKRLNKTISRVDANQRWVNYHGAIPFDTLHQHYKYADICLFASSCENLPNILLEAMACGLPIACSNQGPMPEILGEAGVYFNPEQTGEIAGAILKLIESPTLRSKFAQKSYARAQKYSWQRCADETFGLFRKIA